MREGPVRRIGIVGGGLELVGACRSALRDLGTVREVSLNPETGQLTGDESLDLLLYRLLPPFDPSVRLLARFRRSHTNTPIIVLGSNVPPDLAVELIQCGIKDFISVPLEHVGLHRKVLRAFGLYDGPAFGWSMLNSFHETESAWSGRNRRHCFRVDVVPERPVTAFVGVDDMAYELSVVNLSIATDGWPGGLLLMADADSAPELPFSVWEGGTELEFSVDFNDEGPPIEMIGQMVAGLRPGADGSVCFAMQYWTKRPNDEPSVRRYWAGAQRTTHQPPGAQAQRSSRTSSVARSTRTSRITGRRR